MAMRAMMGVHRGVVSAFDSAAGYGTVRRDDDTEWWFHCTAIADGTREVAVGVRGVFRLVPGGSGRWEAVDLVEV